MTKEFMNVFELNYEFNSTNDEMNEDQYREVMEEVETSLKEFIENCKKNDKLTVPVNIEKFRKITQTVKEKEPKIAETIMKHLDVMEKMIKEHERTIAMIAEMAL